MASSGQAGAPALSDEVPNHSQDASIVGWVVFSSMHHYTDKAAWVAGRTRHLVDDEGPYGWLDGASGSVQTDTYAATNGAVDNLTFSSHSCNS